MPPAKAAQVALCASLIAPYDAALCPSARHHLLIRRDRSLEVVVFFAADEADVFQMGEVLFGRSPVAEHQAGFAEMLVRTAMARIEHQCLLVMSDRRADLAQPPIGIANVVLDVGVAWITQRRGFQH